MAKRAATEQEWQAFKNSNDSIIRINDLRIVGLKLKIKNTSDAVDKKYQENIEILEQKNEEPKNTFWSGFFTRFIYNKRSR